jgi:hypothetical protein
MSCEGRSIENGICELKLNRAQSDTKVFPFD